jgi:signal peptidase I
MSENTQVSSFETSEIKEGNQTLQEFISFLRDLVIIFLIVIIIRVFIVTPFRINGSSMETSYHDKEYIIVDKISYTNLPITYESPKSSIPWIGEKVLYVILGKLPVRIGDPDRGDVVVITPHVDRQKEYYIKRIVGLPGDSIMFEDGDVFIKKSWTENFVKLDETYLSTANKWQTRLPENVKTSQFLIPEEYYWVMGDNRNNSADSRSCFRTCIGETSNAHFIKRRDIVWKVLLNLGYYNIFGEGWLLEAKKLSWTYAPRFLDHPKDATYPELGE